VPENKYSNNDAHCKTQMANNGKKMQGNINIA
jgi:hypothetical protein